MSHGSNGSLMVMVALCGFAAGDAQAQRFQRVIGTQAREFTNGVHETRDAGSVTAGWFMGPAGGPGFGGEDFLVNRHDKDGVLLWSFIWGGEGRDIAYDVEQTEDGGFVVIGETTSVNASHQIGVLRLSPAGTVLWARVYPGTFGNDPLLAPNPGVDIEELPDGAGFVAIGRREGRPVLFRIDPAGAIVTHHTYFVPGADQARMTFTDVDVDRNQQSYVVSGAFARDPAGGGTGIDTLLVRTDPFGIPIFARTYSTFTPAGAPGIDESGDGIFVTRNGTLVIAGRTDMATASDVAMQMIRTDPLGNVIWQRHYPEAVAAGGVRLESAYRAVEENEELMLSNGGRRLPSPLIGGPTSATLLVTDPFGTPMFRWNYLAGDRQWAEDAVVARRTCGWLLGGLIIGAPVGVGLDDGYLIKTNDEGSSGCRENRIPQQALEAPFQHVDWDLEFQRQQEHMTWQAGFLPIETRDPAVCFTPRCVPCPADLSGSADPNSPAYGVPDGVVDAADFFYFLDQFTLGNIAVADLTGSADPNNPAYGIPDGVIDAADFFYYLDLFVLGCP